MAREMPANSASSWIFYPTRPAKDARCIVEMNGPAFVLPAETSVPHA
jgi:hypothetical protein